MNKKISNLIRKLAWEKRLPEPEVRQNVMDIENELYCDRFYSGKNKRLMTSYYYSAIGRVKQGEKNEKRN